MSKACTKCGEAKPLGEFHKRTAARDGRQSACKACACAAINKINTPTPYDSAIAETETRK